MKKALSLLLVFMLILSFAACSKTPNTKPAENSITNNTALTDTKNTENTKNIETSETLENTESVEPKNEEIQPQDSKPNDSIEKPEENDKQGNIEPKPEAPNPNNKAPEKINPAEAEKTVADYVNKNGKHIEEKAEALFSSKTGMTCNCSLKAKGTKLVVQCNIDGFDDLVDSDKTKIKILAGSVKSMLKTEFQAFTEEVPEVTGADIMICEEDGDLITTVSF